MKNKYITPYISFFETQDDIKINDTIKYGKWKNKTATVTGFGTDKNNQPTVITDKGEMSLYHVRIDKLMKESTQDDLIVSITPTSSGHYVAYDPIKKSRIYKKGTTTPMKFNSIQDAKDYAIEFLNKKYDKKNWIFLDESLENINRNIETKILYNLYKDQIVFTPTWEEFVKKNRGIFEKETNKIKKLYPPMVNDKKNKKFEYYMQQLKFNMTSLWSEGKSLKESNSRLIYALNLIKPILKYHGVIIGGAAISLRTKVPFNDIDILMDFYPLESYLKKNINNFKILEYDFGETLQEDPSVTSIEIKGIKYHFVRTGEEYSTGYTSFKFDRDTINNADTINGFKTLHIDQLMNTLKSKDKIERISLLIKRYDLPPEFSGRLNRSTQLDFSIAYDSIFGDRDIDEWRKIFKESYTLEEDLHLSDFTKHSGISDFARKFMKDRQKIKGAGNVSAKLKSIKINRKSDYITVVFSAVPTYTKTAKAVVAPSMQIAKKVRAYEQQIMFVDFFKWAQTKPGYEEAQMTWEEIKEVLNVCSVKVFCNCPSYWWQGAAYIDSLFDAAIHSTTIPPKRWSAYHKDGNFACKHLDILFTSGINLYIQNVTSMINKYLKSHKN